MDRVNAFAGPGAQASRPASARSPTRPRSFPSLAARPAIDDLAKKSMKSTPARLQNAPPSTEMARPSVARKDRISAPAVHVMSAGPAKLYPPQAETGAPHSSAVSGARRSRRPQVFATLWRWTNSKKAYTSCPSM
jgi:hypothetical protein